MPADRPLRRPPSLRRLLRSCSGASRARPALFLVASLQIRRVNAQTRAENRRTTTFLVADGLRQSSNDQTGSPRSSVLAHELQHVGRHDALCVTLSRPRVWAVTPGRG